ncbi:hypothetical protein [Shouchella clausii]|uniref:hypothetical protein n=1 Tax=Shouchella clausii TaxID=79880 RepID=UPI000BA50F67|nr:hypothetical protein [Shouchella clausii]PAE95136.1 hypothetical protein CHH70_06195 [Shouchella clausii]
MEIGGLFVDRVNGSGQTLAFHEGQVLRGVVLNRFADSGLVQIQLKDTRVVAELKADLTVGKTYWFTVQKGQPLPILQKAAEGHSYEQLLTSWDRTPSHRNVRVLALLDSTGLPLTKKGFAGVAHAYASLKLSEQQTKEALLYIKQQNVSVTAATLQAAHVEVNASESLSVALRQFAAAWKHTVPAQLLLQLEELGRQLEAGDVRRGELLKAYLSTLGRVTELLEPIRNGAGDRKAKKAAEDLALRFSLYQEGTLIPSLKQQFIPLFGHDWLLQWESAAENSEEKKPLRFYISAELEQLGYVLVDGRQHEQRLFATIYSGQPAPPAFVSLVEQLRDRLAAAGYTLETCRWLKSEAHTNKTMPRLPAKGVDIRL